MAIALDATSSSANNLGISVTFSHTCTGSNRILIVALSAAVTASDQIASSVTYNGVALTKITSTFGSVASRTTELWYLIAPATGTNNVVVTYGVEPNDFFNVGVASYTGVKQSAQPDASGSTTNETAVTTTSRSITTVADNCWLVGAICDGAADGSAVQSGTTFRLSVYNRVGANGYELFFVDSNAAKSPAGSYSLGETHNSNRSAIIVASISPDVSSPSSSISTSPSSSISSSISTSPSSSPSSSISSSPSSSISSSPSSSISSSISSSPSSSISSSPSSSPSPSAPYGIILGRNNDTGIIMGIRLRHK